MESQDSKECKPIDRAFYRFRQYGFKAGTNSKSRRIKRSQANNVAIDSNTSSTLTVPKIHDGTFTTETSRNFQGGTSGTKTVPEFQEGALGTKTDKKLQKGTLSTKREGKLQDGSFSSKTDRNERASSFQVLASDRISSVQTLEGLLAFQCYSLRQNSQHPDSGRAFSSQVLQLQTEIPASRHWKGFNLSSVTASDRIPGILTLEGLLALQCYSFRKNSHHLDIGIASSSPVLQLRTEFPASRHWNGF